MIEILCTSMYSIGSAFLVVHFFLFSTFFHGLDVLYRILLLPTLNITGENVFCILQ